MNDIIGRIEFAPPGRKPPIEIPDSMINGALAGVLTFSVADLKKMIGELSLAELCADVKTGQARVGSYQYTHTGNLFFPCDPRADEVFIRDIAHGLSCQHRFNGQTLSRMTVAEHCYIASFIGSKETALERLMHDAAEAYIGDMIRPLKVIPLFGDIYLKIEAGIERVICDRYCLKQPLLQGDVKFADETVLKAEIARNIGSKADPLWDDRTVQANNDTPLYFWRPELAEAMFLSRFKELATERGIEQF